jgi:hypothetical protein
MYPVSLLLFRGYKEGRRERERAQEDGMNL